MFYFLFYTFSELYEAKLLSAFPTNLSISLGRLIKQVASIHARTSSRNSLSFLSNYCSICTPLLARTTVLRIFISHVCVDFAVGCRYWEGRHNIRHMCSREMRTMWIARQVSSWVVSYQLSPYDQLQYTKEFPTVLSFEQAQLELSSMKLWSLKDDKITRTYTARNFQVSRYSL